MEGLGFVDLSVRIRTTRQLGPQCVPVGPLDADVDDAVGQFGECSQAFFMPFLPSNSDPLTVDPPVITDPPDVLLRAATTTKFELLTPLKYEVPVGLRAEVETEFSDAAQSQGRYIEVAPGRVGYRTDLASVPFFLWGIVAPYGHQLRPALLHDRLCELASRAQDRVSRNRKRRLADLVFRHALAESRVPLIRQYLLWTGVTLGRYWRANRAACGAAGALALLSIAVFGLVGVGALADLGRLSGFALWLGGGAVLSALWGRDGVPAMIVWAVSPVIGPYSVLTLAILCLLYLAELLVFGAGLLFGKQPNPPIFKPTTWFGS